MLSLRTAVPAALAIATVLACTGATFGQRYVSPPANTSIKIAGKQISVDYYAPSMHGRKIIGRLVPFDGVWCPGANVATGITAEAPLQMGDLKLPKGSYSIWMIPSEKAWTLIINKQSGQHHLDYEPAEDLGRTKLNVKALSTPVETLKFELRADGGNRGTLAMLWENTEASVPFSVGQ